MLRIASAFTPVDEPEDVGFESAILNKAIAALPEIREDVEAFLNVFNWQAAGKDDKYDFFKNEDEDEEYEKILEHKLVSFHPPQPVKKQDVDIRQGISAVEADLEEHKKEISKQLKGRNVTYVSVSAIEYLVEVANNKAALKDVPANWVKISGTQRMARFHTPYIIQMLRERDQHKEALAAECDKAFKRFLARIATKYQALRDCVASLAVLDCILSLAAVAQQPGYVKPTFVDEPIIDVKEGRHPMVEQLLLDAYVPNDISLSHNGKRAMLVTGPNMGGKSSYVRQVALISIMAQIGSYVPAESARLGLLDAVFTRMGAFDNMMAGESTFMVELSETSDILKQATSRSLVILDELGRGTSTHDGVAIAHAVFDYVVKELKALLLFVTHYPLLARFGDMYPDEVVNTHMAFEETGEGGEEVAFLYRVAEGVAHRSYGLNVARLAGLPRKVIEVAAVKSKALEEQMKQREAERWAKTVARVMHGEEVDVEALARSLEFVEV
jgi:DNA mismatch repair protein MSH3